MSTDFDIQDSLSLIREIQDYPKPGILFRDITPLLADAEAFAKLLKKLSPLALDVDYIAGIEARGFILASALASMTGKGFIPIRKKGKLPSRTYSRRYGLEYGEDELEIHQDAFPPGSKILLMDDVLATGGTISAALDLISDVGGEVSLVSVLIEIESLNGRDNVARSHQNSIEALLKV
ncbi:Apt Adenine/guanine phosphoribosyltransferases and related PRPP-binding proteins [Candidatus Nanopelagicaceae bacterium]